MISVRNYGIRPHRAKHVKMSLGIHNTTHVLTTKVPRIFFFSVRDLSLNAISFYKNKIIIFELKISLIFFSKQVHVSHSRYATHGCCVY